jgi:hypothetical protein
MLTRRLSSEQITATLKDELEAAGDHEQAKLVVGRAYIKARAEAGITFNAAWVGLALGFCDSFGYLHDGKQIKKVEINSGVFVPVVGNVSRPVPFAIFPGPPA